MIYVVVWFVDDHNHSWYWGAVRRSILRYLTLQKLAQRAYFDELVQERRNSSALAMELRLTCTDLSICAHTIYVSSKETSWEKHAMDMQWIYNQVQY